MYSQPFKNSKQVEQLNKLLSEKILILDGAMGTMIQSYELDESDFRGERFKDHPMPLRGNNDLLTLTQPDKIAAIHRAFLDAGANLIETNTFNSTSISQADYGMEDLVRELNFEAARLAQERGLKLCCADLDVDGGGGDAAFKILSLRTFVYAVFGFGAVVVQMTTAAPICSSTPWAAKATGSIATREAASRK